MTQNKWSTISNTTAVWLARHGAVRQRTDSVWCSITKPPHNDTTDAVLASFSRYYLSLSSNVLPGKSSHSTALATSASNLGFCTIGALEIQHKRVEPKGSRAAMLQGVDFSTLFLTVLVVFRDRRSKRPNATHRRSWIRYGDQIQVIFSCVAVQGQ